jgi:hypothetical protein
LTLAEFRRKLQAQHGEGHWQHLPIPHEEWSHQNLETSSRIIPEIRDAAEKLFFWGSALPDKRSPMTHPRGNGAMCISIISGSHVALNTESNFYMEDDTPFNRPITTGPKCILRFPPCFSCDFSLWYAITYLYISDFKSWLCVFSQSWVCVFSHLMGV